jgi:hypothetical protein
LEDAHIRNVKRIEISRYLDMENHPTDQVRLCTIVPHFGVR